MGGMALAEEVLNNAAILEMHEMNLGDAVILEKIKTSKCQFDTSLAGLKQLKGAKVSDAVIQAMVAASAPAAGKVTATASASAVVLVGDANDPATPHPAGVWMMKDQKLTRMDSEVSGEISSGGFVGPWGIGKVGQSVRIAGLESETKIAERRPTFYLYIGNNVTAGTMTGTPEFTTAQSPREIVLVEFTQSAKNNCRVLGVGKGGAYAQQSGIDAKATREFDVEKLADGCYKVTPKQDLADGEYAFCTVQTRGQGRFFTFSVKGPTP
jgi:hypothetical protein